MTLRKHARDVQNPELLLLLQDSPLSAQILFLDSAESVQEVSACIVHVLAWRRRSHRAEKWKLWSFTVSGRQCVSTGADGNER